MHAVVNTAAILADRVELVALLVGELNVVTFDDVEYVGLLQEGDDSVSVGDALTCSRMVVETLSG